MADTIFGGMTGKAEKELKTRKSKLDRMEEDASKAEVRTDGGRWHDWKEDVEDSK